MAPTPPAWLRDQPWYTGTFATLGPSYLGQTQWALLEDPPADMVAAVVVVGVHDFAATTWGSGAFAVSGFLSWSNMVSHQEDPGRLQNLLLQLRNHKIVARTAAEVPLGAAGRTLLGDGAPWWEQWVSHDDVDDPFWDRYRFYGGLDRARVPVKLIGGWQDVFLEQTIQQYHRLNDRGVEVTLTVGPWTHSNMTTKGGAGQCSDESLEWLDSHFAGRRCSRRSPVRVFVTGGKSDSVQSGRAGSTCPRGRPGNIRAGVLLGARPTGARRTGRDTSTVAARSSFTFRPARPDPDSRRPAADTGCRLPPRRQARRTW